MDSLVEKFKPVAKEILNDVDDVRAVFDNRSPLTVWQKIGQGAKLAIFATAIFSSVASANPVAASASLVALVEDVATLEHWGEEAKKACQYDKDQMSLDIN